MRAKLIVLGCLAGLLFAPTSEGATIAYWRFEGGVSGTDVPHAGTDGAFDPTVLDASGNGNHLSAYTQGSYAGFRYSPLVPFANVPQSGDANGLSVHNTGGYPAAFTSYTDTATGINARTIEPLAFTVEAMYKPENTNWYRTVVGRDARNITTSGDANLAAFYLGLLPNNRVVARYTDKAGVLHEVIGTNAFTDGFAYDGSNADGHFGASAGNFHHLAAVSDGSTFSVYVDGNLEGSIVLTGTSGDLALNNGLTSTDLGEAPGKWTVGRGMYAGGHGDRAYGLIDEVRISDSALSPNQFLTAVPEPAAAMLGLAAIAGCSARRRLKR